MIIEKILDIIYPPKCLLCGKVNENFLCEKCRIIINKLEEAQKVYFDYKKSNFNEHIYLFKYEGLIRNKIIEYKFNDKSYYYHVFANILIKNKKIYDFLNCYDIITSVPMHNKRKKQRGYNQTELIARELSNNIKKLIYRNIIIKNKNTIPQSKLNKEQRIENSKNIYELNKRDKELCNLKNKKILLFDDIYTTGSTVMECAKVLKNLEPKKIGVITIAKDLIK